MSKVSEGVCEEKGERKVRRKMEEGSGHFASTPGACAFFFPFD